MQGKTRLAADPNTGYKFNRPGNHALLLLTDRWLMSRSWVESRRRVKKDSLTQLATTAPVGAALPAVVDVKDSAPEQQNTPKTPPMSGPAANRALALVSVIRGIGSPLQSAVSEVSAGLRERGQDVTAVDEARAYAQLVQQVVSIGRTACQTLEVKNDELARWNGEPLRWAILEAIADMTGAHFRAAGVLQPSPIAGQVAAAVTQIALDGARREDLMPGLGKATQARLGLDMLKAVPPVLHAVARFSFGRNPLVLATEVAWELQYKAIECTRRLLAVGSTLEEWHSVYGAFVISAGQLYAEAHFAEAERISRLSPNERNALMHGEVPMTGVWEQFDRKVDLLASFAGYMTVPGDSSNTGAGVPVVKSPF